jgi:Zn-dependent M28 family amino/carboxypeptidase
MNKIFYYIIAVSLVGLASCKQESKKDIKEVKLIEAPIFNPDSAYLYIEQQVDFGPRFLSSPGWDKCGDFLVEKFKTFTPNVIEQNAPITTYDGKKHTLRNIIASFNPEKNNRIMLCAHWDTRHVADYDTINQEDPILGANDGGSGVGVLIEVARILSQKESSIGVDIILFDAEDYGQPQDYSDNSNPQSWCIGSQYWSQNPHVQNYYARYGILLDMVGAKDAVFAHEGYSKQYGERILKKVWKKAHEIGYQNYFRYIISPAILDDHYFVNTIANIPTIDIIEYDQNTMSGFNKHWHTHGDDMDNIDKSTLKAVGQTLLEVIYNE